MALTVTNPTVGLEWIRGNEYQIQYTGANAAFDKINFYLFRGAASTFLASYYISWLGTNGTYYWSIPSA